MTTAHALIVLAAGGSVRLGRPKQLLTRDGEPLVRRAVRIGLATQPRRAIVVLGAHREAIAPTLADLSCEVAMHAAWRDGLAASLRAGAARLGDHRGPVLILVCDQPALDGHHLDALLGGAAHAASRCAATLHAGQPGVPAVVPAALLAGVVNGHRDDDASANAALIVDDLADHDCADVDRAGEDMTAAGDRGLAPRLRSLPSSSIFALDAPELALDVDTPDDLRRAITLGLVDDDAVSGGSTRHV